VPRHHLSQFSSVRKTVPAGDREREKKKLREKKKNTPFWATFPTAAWKQAIFGSQTRREYRKRKKKRGGPAAPSISALFSLSYPFEIVIDGAGGKKKGRRGKK